MSALLDSLCGNARLAECTKHAPPSRLDVIARGSKLGAARELIRSAQIHDLAELMQSPQNVLAACSFKDEHTQALDDLICDIEGPVHYPPEPEVLEYSGRERGQLDSGTAGVRHRSAA